MRYFVLISGFCAVQLAVDKRRSIYYHISCGRSSLIVMLRTCVRQFQSRIPDFYFKLVDLQRLYTVGHAVDTLFKKNQVTMKQNLFFLSCEVYHLKSTFPKFETFDNKIENFGSF